MSSAIKELINDVGCSVLNDGEGELEYGPKMDEALDELYDIQVFFIKMRHHFAKIVRENAGPIWVVHNARVFRDEIDAFMAKMDSK